MSLRLACWSFKKFYSQKKIKKSQHFHVLGLDCMTKMLISPDSIHTKSKVANLNYPHLSLKTKKTSSRDILRKEVVLPPGVRDEHLLVYT